MIEQMQKSRTPNALATNATNNTAVCTHGPCSRASLSVLMVHARAASALTFPNKLLLLLVKK